jgi:hypothetical protein
MDDRDLLGALELLELKPQSIPEPLLSLLQLPGTDPGCLIGKFPDKSL